VIDMQDVQGSDRKPVSDVRRALGQVWADIVHGQRRAAALNTPWVARRRAAGQH
jgi:hypothetical protein